MQFAVVSVTHECDHANNGNTAKTANFCLICPCAKQPNPSTSMVTHTSTCSALTDEFGYQSKSLVAKSGSLDGRTSVQTALMISVATVPLFDGLMARQTALRSNWGAEELCEQNCYCWRENFCCSRCCDIHTHTAKLSTLVHGGGPRS